jgi:hypothetical protein
MAQRGATRRVEDWRGTKRGPFPAPASSNPACRFPAPGFPGRFASWFMRPITWEHFRATRYSASSSRRPGVASPVLLGLRHDVELPPQVLQTDGRRYLGAPASHVDPRLSGLPCSPDFAAGRGGLLQLLEASWSPCCRSKPRRSAPPRQPDGDGPCCLRGIIDRSASGVGIFRGHLTFTCVTAR